MADGVTWSAISERRLARRNYRRAVDYLAYAGDAPERLEARRAWFSGLRTPLPAERIIAVSRRVERMRRGLEARGRNYAWRDQRLPAGF